jgi:uncharacterized protein (DUF305 family)
MQTMLKKLTAVIAMAALLLTVGLVSAQALTRSERAEIRFLEGMIDHHQMALDMAADCVAKATTASVRAVCENIIAAQSAEIERMQGWLLDWYNITYAPVSMIDAESGGMMDMHTMMDMMHGQGSGDDDAHSGGSQDSHGGHGASSAGPFTDPPMMMGMFAGFNRLEGVAYEIAWLESMVDHHDDAIHMAERMLTRAVHAELGELAQQIIADQSAEIALIETLIAELAS